MQVVIYRYSTERTYVCVYTYVCMYVCMYRVKQKKRELLKCVVAAMYSWQHCGTATLSYRQPRHLVIMDQWKGQQRAFAIKMF